MARRRSRIREAINRALHTGGDYIVYYRHRDPERGEVLRGVGIGEVSRVTGWAMELRGGDTIPLHRVVEIRDSSGRVVWRRGAGWSTG